MRQCCSICSPVKAVDKRFIDGGPEGGKQDVQLFRSHVRPADSPPLCLRQKGAGGLCQHLHPVVLEIAYRVPSERESSRTKIVMAVVKKAHPPHHVRAVHIPGFDEFCVRHGGRVTVSPGNGPPRTGPSPSAPPRRRTGLLSPCTAYTAPR